MKMVHLIALSVRIATCVALVAVCLLLVRAQGNFYGRIDRPLRYHPDGKDFVIENGKEFFNRPLYGGNTAFRVDAGDKPEFVLYLPGRGGNLRFGFRTALGNKWLQDADKVTSRYRPGSMIYEIRDRLLGNGVLEIEVLTTYETEGLVIRASLHNVGAVGLVWAYGGANGERGRRDGDIGTEKVPISEFFQLKPEYCKDSKFSIEANNFTLESKAAKIVGLMPQTAKLVTGDANQWRQLDGLLVSAGKPTETAVIVGSMSLTRKKPEYFGFQKMSTANVGASKINESQQLEDSAQKLSFVTRNDDLARIFDETENYRQSIAGRVVADTPDPFINAAVAALNVAGDSVWDEQQVGFMHGAVAWRTKLLGWRGPYLGDDLGWHDRMRRHLAGWASRQNIAPISDRPFTQDASVNFARNEPELHSNGDISNSHYDMNIVYIDELFRHLLWTGDVEYARKMFPVIARHLAWERRLFRREFGPDKLPLYEAYVAIWASDDLQYSGGGVTHASAYNYYHNKMAARIARLIGEDSTEYQAEADLIMRGMKANLWLADRGWFAENKDLLGAQLLHPNAALWTFYHTLDSQAATPMEAWQMSRFVDTQIAHIPIRGADVPAGDLYTLPTTSWMPYAWSTNNVVMAETMHTSLAIWQSGRPDEAYKLFKGSILDSMFLGICPGNAGMTTGFDIARGESQRDFADGIAMSSRALIEGLFGVKPDALAGELTVQPGFPEEWEHASLHHPDLDLSFRRSSLTDTYIVESRFPKAMMLRLKLNSMRDGISKVSVNGKNTDWRVIADSVGLPKIEIASPATDTKYVVNINWKGNRPETAGSSTIAARGREFHVSTGKATLTEIFDPQNALTSVKQSGNSFRAMAAGAEGHRTVFAKLKQGEIAWWKPVNVDIRQPFEIISVEKQDPRSLSFKIRNNTGQAFSGIADIHLALRSVKMPLKIAPLTETNLIKIDAAGELPGTDPISIKLGNDEIVNGVAVNWKLDPESGQRFETVNLGPYFNDKVTNIFKHEYLSPRSPFVSLAMPKQGIGSWAHWDEQFEVDDAGLRKLAGQNGGKLRFLPDISFAMSPADTKNIAFVSQWDNFPKEISIPLSGTASHIYLLMAGSTNQMQSRMDNGEVVVAYADGTAAHLALNNPVNWWPIDQDFFIDDYAFRRPESIPPRVDLKSGIVRYLDLERFTGKGGKVPGGAATILDLPLDGKKEIRSMTVRAITNEVVIGLMSATLARN